MPVRVWHAKPVRWPAPLTSLTAAVATILGGCTAPPTAETLVRKPFIVFLSGETEYDSARTLPAFKAWLESRQAVTGVYLERQGESIPGLDALNRADLLVLFVRRMTPPAGQLVAIRGWLDAGKPLVALRTSSHAFENWKEFDRDVLGGNYSKHYGKQEGTTVRAVPAAAGHPILRGVAGEFPTASWLYKNTPLASTTTLLLEGSVPGRPPEPLAWTNAPPAGNRVFYTSLGHPQDFESEPFRRLLVNAIFWALGRETVDPDNR